MKNLLKSFVGAALAVVAAGCTLGSPDAPLPTGPSTTGLALTISADRDIITFNGQDSALITVTARDINGQPVQGVEIRFQILVDGTEIDFGQLSSKVAFTNASGQATVRYTAPGSPPATLTADPIIEIGAVAVGSNFTNSLQPRTVAIRLARPGVIVPPPAPNGAPTASFTFSPASPAAFQEVEFNATASSDPDGTIVSYNWNFGDGDSETTTTPIVEHTYDEPGSYTVSLVVVDNGGSVSDVVSQSLSVGSAQEPTASFVFSPEDPAPGQDVHFDASASRAPEGRTIVRYEWNFGDGTTATTTTPTVTKAGGYATENAFVVTLTVTDSFGRTSTTTKTVPVDAG